ERGLIQFDPILGVEVEILDRKILAIGNDDLPRRAGVVEAETPRAGQVELAPHAAVVGARLEEASLQRMDSAEIIADLADDVLLVGIERDAIVGVRWGGRGRGSFL